MEVAEGEYDSETRDLSGRSPSISSSASPARSELGSLRTAMAEEGVQISESATHAVENAITLDYSEQLGVQEEYTRVEAEIELGHEHSVTTSSL